MRPLLPESLVEDLNVRFENAEPGDIVRWALEESGLDRVAVASAFQAEGTCVIHMATRIRPEIPVLFLETGFHFRETLAFRDEVARDLRLNVRELRGEHTPASQAVEHGDRLYERDPNMCCEINKVRPFTRALHDLDMWITGLRRDSSPSRAATPIVEQYELEPGKALVKVNPVARWSRPDVWRYLKDEGLPHHPLYDIGYAQIGCAPCTRLRFPGEDERESRWDGSQKVECGIHAQEAARR
ncbi:MAG: phosphoadenylyl-sulfate reductase [Actinomycetota bacterium]